MAIFWLSNLIIFVFSFFFSVPGVFLSGGDLLNIDLISKEELISADKAAVLSANGRFLLFSHQADEKQPIASITKLMTALVFLETNPNWEDVYKIRKDDYVLGGKLHLFLGDSVTLKDLFLTSLVASDNGATLSLVHASSLSEDEFVARMNEKAKKLRLLNTSFVDPIGLSKYNVSTAREVALLALAAYQESEIAAALKLKEHNFITKEGKEKYIESTDYLLFDKQETAFVSLGGKTGYTDKAGYCFTGLFQAPNGEILAASVLNSLEKNGRFQESKKIIAWVLNNYFKE